MLRILHTDFKVSVFRICFACTVLQNWIFAIRFYDFRNGVPKIAFYTEKTDYWYSISILEEDYEKNRFDVGDPVMCRRTGFCERGQRRSNPSLKLWRSGKDFGGSL
jgi:hypothetical protein